MESLDPIAVQYRKLKKDRRKFDDPSYHGPERRLEKRRQMTLERIIKKLEREAREA